ncbi:MAG TPA: metallophosphoesterase family protein [Solirubrobacteraceae bacterium]|nr:metallophosphoesterase family protein [Solirubrobacteraceae bacterium]
MLVAIISDTHIPKRAKALPGSCREHLRAADLIVHAGDLITMPVLEELRGYGEVVAVQGNADDDVVQEALPEHLELDLAGRRVVVIHNSGPRFGRVGRLRRRYPGADAVIFGHSHIPLHETDTDGFQLFNPGSATDKRRQPKHTMGLARCSADGVKFTLVTLD